MCPQIHGLFVVELACLLMLIGGVERLDDTGTHIRGNVHMLLVGDPGTGALLEYVFAQSPTPPLMHYFPQRAVPIFNC